VAPLHAASAVASCPCRCCACIFQEDGSSCRGLAGFMAACLDRFECTHIALHAHHACHHVHQSASFAYPCRRLANPWPELAAYIESLDLATAEDHVHSHIPYGNCLPCHAVQRSVTYMLCISIRGCR